MANLFWKLKKETRSLLATPFNSEEEFEDLIFSTSVILEDIFLIKRQIRGGEKRGIPDIIGLDSDGNACIIEMKNITVDASIIPQVLEYAFWAERNPDSIKSLWLELEEKPEDIPLAWDNLQVRIIIIAPNILRSTLDIVDKINYPVDLIEIKRWMESTNEFLLVNKLEQEDRQKVRAVSGLENYDLDFYMRNFNKTSAREFVKYTKKFEQIVKKNKWPLDTKFNKHYSTFKAGYFNVFGIQWIGSKTFALFVRLSEEECRSIKPKYTRYDKTWNQAYYYIEPGKTNIDDYLPILKKAVKKFTSI